MDLNGVDFSKTSSCYDPSKENIRRRCDACLLRKKGFEEARIKDPLGESDCYIKLKKYLNQFKVKVIMLEESCVCKIYRV